MPNGLVLAAGPAVPQDRTLPSYAHHYRHCRWAQSISVEDLHCAVGADATCPITGLSARGPTDTVVTRGCLTRRTSYPSSAKRVRHANAPIVPNMTPPNTQPNHQMWCMPSDAIAMLRKTKNAATPYTRIAPPRERANGWSKPTTLPAVIPPMKYAASVAVSVVPSRANGADPRKRYKPSAYAP